MSRPKMILLDEPSMGLAPQIVDEIFEIVPPAQRRRRRLLPARRAEHRGGAAPRHPRLHSGIRAASCSTAKPGHWRRNEDVKEFLSRRGGGPAARASRTSNTTSGASVGWRDGERNGDVLRSARDPKPGGRASGAQMKALRDAVAGLMVDAGVEQPLRRHRCRVAADAGPISRRSRCLRKSELKELQALRPPFAGLSTPQAPRGRAAVSPRRGRSMSRRGRAPIGGARRGAFHAAGVPARRRGAQHLLLSPHPGWLHSRRRSAGARLSGDPGRAGQQRGAARPESPITGRAPMPARRTSSRSCSMPARRPGRDVSSITRGSGLRRGVAGLAPGRARGAGRRGGGQALCDRRRRAGRLRDQRCGRAVWCRG